MFYDTLSLRVLWAPYKETLLPETLKYNTGMPHSLLKCIHCISNLVSCRLIKHDARITTPSISALFAMNLRHLISTQLIKALQPNIFATGETLKSHAHATTLSKLYFSIYLIYRLIFSPSLKRQRVNDSSNSIYDLNQKISTIIHCLLLSYQPS
jgi:hypothetical protein